MKNKSKHNKGFTLIETFVAVTILLLAVTGPLYLVTKGLAISRSVKGQITAAYLAQEAVEYIRNARDTNVLGGVNWLNGLAVCVGGKCVIDSPEQNIASCGGACPVLKYNSASKLYGYNSGEDSIFRRETQINKINPTREAEIVVDVFWTEGSNNRQFTVKEYLLNWQ